jgi:hypothetical protein
MTDLKVVSLPPAEPNRDLIDACERMLEAARAGTLMGLATTEFMTDGSFMTRLHGSMTNVEAIADLASSLHDVIEISRALPR